MFLVEGMEENSAVSERGVWMNSAFGSEEVLGNNLQWKREKEKILMMKKKNEWFVPDDVSG